MSITWGALRTQIARKLNDSSMATYSADILQDAVNDALNAFAASHTGVASDYIITGDGTTYVFDLPDDMVESENAGIYAVEFPEQGFIYEERYSLNHVYAKGIRLVACWQDQFHPGTRHRRHRHSTLCCLLHHSR